MARGWESKSVEEQIQAREEAATAARSPQLTEAERARRVKREGLLLSRTRTLAAIETARDPRYREQLQRALAHLDAELAALDGI